jgi:hypothetical protein
MSAARIILAIAALTFVLFTGITLIVPSFPPAQLLSEYVSILQTTLTIWGMSAALVNGITNGFYWTILVITPYGLAQLLLHTRKLRPLPPMPVAPRLKAPQLVNSRVDSRGNRFPSAVTIPSAPSSTARKRTARTLNRTEPVPIKVSKGPKAELDIATIEGIGPVRCAIFRNSGIDTVSDLLRMGATELGRHRLASMVGVTSATVLRWVYQGDLLRVRGIGGKYSALLESAGVNAAKDLPTKSPRHLCQKLKAVNKERNLVGRNPRSKTIEIWVHNAKDLDPILVERAHARVINSEHVKG